MHRLTSILALWFLCVVYAHGALQSRLGGLAYYDDIQDITWLADANAAGGGMAWETANAWATGLNVAGVTGWRLPEMVDIGNNGCNEAYNGTDCGYNVVTGEMAHLYYGTLGNKAYYDSSGIGPQSGWGLAHTSPFSGLTDALYWYGTEYALDGNYAWYFSFSHGNQHPALKSSTLFAIAVYDGDVGEVPIPPTAWLFLSALGGLGWIKRKRS